jgi:hypothetical protein
MAGENLGSILLQTQFRGSLGLAKDDFVIPLKLGVPAFERFPTTFHKLCRRACCFS